MAGVLIAAGCAGELVPETRQPIDSPTIQPATSSPVHPGTTPTPAGITSSPPPTVPPSLNKYVTVAQLNLWYHGSGCFGGWEQFDCSGKRLTPLTPLLGATYDSADPAVIEQQIDWAAEYGVDAFSIEWTTPRSIDGSMEVTIDDKFLKAPNLAKIRWCIFDDFVLRMRQTPGFSSDLSNGPDFDDPAVADLFVEDFDHFAQKYFGHPQYLTIGGRPVIYVWGTWNAIGSFRATVQRARAAVQARGFDPFIVGDVITADDFRRQVATAYDADTNFTFLVGGTHPNVGKAADALDQVLSAWAANIDGRSVAGRDEQVIVQPGFTPQYDDTNFDDGTHTYVPAMSREQVTKMAQVVRKHAQPAGAQGPKLVWLNTWNNWAETTTLEPTIDEGPKYPAGNYGFDMVEVIRDVFGAQTLSG